MKNRQKAPKQVTVLGLGLFGGGAGAARYFAERGSKVVVSDVRPPEALAEAMESLSDLKLDYRLGKHEPSHFEGSEIVIVNPAVAPGSPPFEMARQSGAALETEINLLFKLAPAPIVAVSGTNGKSTTVALLGEMLKASGRTAWIGGNIGGSLLPDVEKMTPKDAIVLEISSFQAERLAWTDLSPHVAVVLNITPNHLDRHRDIAEYAAAKRQLLERQTEKDFAILNGEDPILKDWENVGRARKLFFGAEPLAPAGLRLEGEEAMAWVPDAWLPVSLTQLRLPGAHNRFNAACAATAAWLMGADKRAIEAGMAAFTGLPDRLEFVTEKNRIRFYNDSIATTPESTMVALKTFESPIVLIAGGSSKNLSYDAVGAEISRRAKHVVLLGATGQEIGAAVSKAGAPPVMENAANLEEAVRNAFKAAVPGDVVLLSPASASFDMFRNYAERGRQFKAIANAL